MYDFLDSTYDIVEQINTQSCIVPPNPANIADNSPNNLTEGQQKSFSFVASSSNPPPFLYWYIGNRPISVFNATQHNEV